MKYIFFDFDGTISDARKLTHETFIDVMKDMGFKISKKKVRELMGFKMHIILEKLGFEGDLVEEVRKRFYQILVMKKSLKKLKLCCDLRPLYELKKKGYRLVVVSNSHSSFLHASIKYFKIEDLFYAVYGAEGFASKNEMLKKLFKKYKIKPKDTVYVGDRFSDIDFAHKAHTYAVGVYNKCSWSTKKELLAEKPDYLVSDFDGLKEIVLGL